MSSDDQPSGTPTMDLECRGLRSEEVPNYLAFAARAFGEHSPHTRESRLKWLYEANPLTRGYAADLLVAVSGERVVGCLHQLWLPWVYDGQPFDLLVLHNLMVEEEYRHGVGLRLLFAAREQAGALLLSGVNEAADRIYAKLKDKLLPCTWQSRVLSRPRVALGLVARRLGAAAQPTAPLGAARSWTQGRYEVRVLTDPSDLQVAELLTLSSTARLHLGWTPETFRWRFFHAHGPRHAAVALSIGGQLVARAVVSRGQRHGVPIGRLVEMVSSGREHYTPLARAATTAMARLGAGMAFSATSNDEASAALAGSGWRERDHTPTTRYRLPDRQAELVADDLWGAGWDFGFDA